MSCFDRNVLSECVSAFGEERAMRWVRAIPKAELHVHLEGAIPLDALWSLVQKYGGTRDVASVEALQARFVYRDFPHFIRTWVWKNQFLRGYEDFTFISEAFARSLCAQNIRYAEVFCSPADFTKRHGLEPERLLCAIREGLDRVEGVEVALVVDLIRDFGPVEGMEMLGRVVEVAGDAGVIGVGIGGSEQKFPPEPWSGVYEAAREAGLKTSAHAGEAAGPESVWGAVRVLGVDRIGHGTRAVEDSALMDELARRGVPVELCPRSNVCTGVIGALEDHPVRRFLEWGIPVTINTDDPAMFANPMDRELWELACAHALTVGELEGLVLSGVETSWMSGERKGVMLERFQRDLGRARGVLIEG